jgi:hypothetical protein
LHILLVAMDLSLLHSRDPCLSIHATSKDDPTSNHRLGSRGHFLAILREINRHSLLAVQRSAAQRSDKSARHFSTEVRRNAKSVSKKLPNH